MHMLWLHAKQLQGELLTRRTAVSTAITCLQEALDGCQSLLGVDHYQTKEVEQVLLRVMSTRLHAGDEDEDGEDDGEMDGEEEKANMEKNTKKQESEDEDVGDGIVTDDWK